MAEEKFKRPLVGTLILGTKIKHDPNISKDVRIYC